MSGGIIGWLVGDGAVNNHDAGSLVVGGLGEWYGSEFVVLDGFTWLPVRGGVDFTVGDRRVHYSGPSDNRPHYKVTDQRPHYEVTHRGQGS